MIWIDGAVRKACHLNVTSRYEVLSEFLYDLEHPNSNFLQIEEPVKPEAKLKKYRLYFGLLFALNFILLLLLVTK
jgi:protein phosphatase